MKTLADWHASGLNLSDFMPEPCEIDEALHLYIGEVVAPVYVTPEVIQGGDPVRQKESLFDFETILLYMTTSCVNDKYFYLGILPEFKG